MPSLFYAGQPDYIEKLNTLATAASMTNGTVAASFLSLAVTGTATAASFVGPLTGNASTATTLATARNINGVSFNGSADITVTAAAGTLTGATLAAGVTASSLTSLGTLTALTVSGQASFAAGSAAAPSVKVGTAQDGLFSIAGGALGFAANGAQALRLDASASAVNSIYMYANLSGNTPTIRTLSGVDANVGLSISSQGSGVIDLFTDGAVAPQFRVSHTASSVNIFNVTGAATTNSPVFSVIGSDANIGAIWRTKGTGSHLFQTGTATQFEVSHVASAVNRLQVGGGAAGIPPYLVAAGSDTNINIYYGAKGSGSHAFASGAGLIQFQVNHTASAVNYPQVTGSATGGNVTYGVAGSDTNIDFAITPKGTGNVRFGTHSAIAAETVTGYITIKDSSGTERKLAVLS